MCSVNQQRIFVTPRQNPKVLRKKWKKADTSHIKINFKSNIGHNSMRKMLKSLAEKTVVPLPSKGSFGAHRFCHRALTDLKQKGV
jgi:hypothetical protein